MVLFYFLILAIGFVILVKGADWFVDGASGIAKNFRVPEVIIGLTIVALGTSAPELAVSTTAGLQGSNEIAFSNVIGSNMFNLLCVLGVCSVIRSVPVDADIMKRDFPFSILLSFLLLGFAGFRILITGGFRSATMYQNVAELGRIEGIILLVIFVAYIAYLIQKARKDRKEESGEKILPMGKCVLLLLVGIAMIVAGGQSVVYAAKAIARTFGMSETLIGLTIVAIGTSLPELVTSIVASKKGENGLAVGNVVGSNILNLIFILGVSSALNPIAVNLASVYDLLIMIVIFLLCYIFAKTKNVISRREGILMLLIYVADVVFAFFR